MVCRCDLLVQLFGHGIYFAHCANVKICGECPPSPWGWNVFSSSDPMKTPWRSLVIYEIYDKEKDSMC